MCNLLEGDCVELDVDKYILYLKSPPPLADQDIDDDGTKVQG